MRRVSIRFETDIQGVIPSFLARIGFGHSLPLAGQSGRVKSIEGDELTLECKYPIVNDRRECDSTYECDVIFCTGETYKYVIFMDAAGVPSEEFEFTTIDFDKISIIGDLPEWINVDYGHDKTPFTMVIEEIQDYIVTAVKPQSGNTVVIEAINYDERVYTDTFLTDGSAILTDGTNDLII